MSTDYNPGTHIPNNVDYTWDEAAAAAKATKALRREKDKKEKEKQNIQGFDKLTTWSKNPKGWGPFTRYLFWGAGATTGIAVVAALIAFGLGLPIIPIAVSAYVISNVFYSYKLYTKLPIKKQRKFEGYSIKEEDTNDYLRKRSPKNGADKSKEMEQRAPQITQQSMPRHHDPYGIDRRYIHGMAESLANRAADAPQNAIFFKQLERDEKQGLSSTSALLSWVANSPTLFNEKIQRSFQEKDFREVFLSLKPSLQELIRSRYSLTHEKFPASSIRRGIGSSPLYTKQKPPHERQAPERHPRTNF